MFMSAILMVISLRSHFMPTTAAILTAVPLPIIMASGVWHTNLIPLADARPFIIWIRMEQYIATRLVFLHVVMSMIRWVMFALNAHLI